MATTLILERSEPLSQVRERIGRLASGSPGIVLVAGEAGVGKTTLLSSALDGLGPGIRVLRGACDDLVAANPLGPLREAFAASPVAGAVAEGRFEDVLTALADHLRGPPPTLLVVEDLHWADDATVDVLAYLARRISRLRLLLVTSYRDDEVVAGHPAERFLATASGTAVLRLRLEPLRLGSVERLAVGSGWDPEVLQDVTGGNPFYVTETIASPPDTPVPSSVSDAVLARLRRLSPRTRDGVERISVWPGVLGFSVAEDLLGADVDALGEAEELGLLTVTADGIRFRHEMARLATEASLSGLRRRRLQESVTAVLRARGSDDLPRLVHHAILCGDVDTVAEFAPPAGQRSAQVGAHRQALAFFSAALEHADRLAPEVLAEVLDGYAWELHNAHRFPEAVEHGREAVARRHRIGRRAAEADSLSRLARFLFMAGDPDEARVCAEGALRLSDPEDQGSLASAEAAVGALRALDVARRDAAALLAQARERARSVGRPDVVALTYNYDALAVPGLTPDQRLELLRSSITVARGGDEDEAEARGYTNLAELLYRYGRHDELAAEVETWLAFTRDRGFWSHAFNLEVHAALVTARRGHPQAARNRLGSLLSRFPDSGMLAAYLLPTYGRLLARLGDPGARDLLQTGCEVARRQRMLIGMGYAAAGLAEWAWLHDEPGTAADVVATFSPVADRPTAAPLWAEIRRYAADTGVEVPDGPPSGSHDPWDAGLAGDWSGAARRWAAIGDEHEAARELAASGSAEPTLEALSTFHRLGEEAAARVARRRLAAIGVPAVPRGPSPSTRRNPHQLTDRQVRIAELVAEGLTNAEIAARLVLSVRTVDTHVSAVLAKLGVSHRREVARIARTWPPGERPAAAPTADPDG